MTDIYFGLGFTLVTALIVLAGDVALKVAAEEDHGLRSWHVLFGISMYAVSALCWFYAMKHVTLAQAAVAYSMLTLLALCAIGAFGFGERLVAKDVLGIAFALVSISLLLR